MKARWEIDMSRHVSAKAQYTIWKTRSEWIELDQLPRIFSYINLHRSDDRQAMHDFAQDAMTRIPGNKHEAAILTNLLTQLPTKYRIDARCVAMLNHSTELAQMHDLQRPVYH
jgi:hypothetical protein